MLAGYSLLTPFDIFVGRNEDGSHNVRWNGPEEWSGFIGERDKWIRSNYPKTCRALSKWAMCGLANGGGKPLKVGAL